MEGHGTNLDKWLQLEGEVHSLRKDISEIRSDNADTKAQISSLARGQDALQHLLTDVATKLDETRTRRPNLVAMSAVLVAVFGLVSSALGFGFVLMTSWLDPIRQEQQKQHVGIQQMQQDYWTQSDAERGERIRAQELQQILDSLQRVEDRQWNYHGKEE